MNHTQQRQQAAKLPERSKKRPQLTSCFNFLEQQAIKDTQNQSKNAPPSLESQSDLFSYSHTHSFLEVDDFYSLVHKLIFLLSSRQHIATHVSQSLGVKGYHKEMAEKVALVVANSFGQYITIAEKICSWIGREGQAEKMRREKGQMSKNVDDLRVENQKQRQTIGLMEEENDRLMKRCLKGTQAVPQNRQIVAKYRSQAANIMNKMNALEIRMYERLSEHQQKLLKLSYLSNKAMFSSPKQQRSRVLTQRQMVVNRENQAALNNNISAIGKNDNQIAQLKNQLILQQKLYDQLAEKNISLQKELFFCHHSQGPSFYQEDSLHIIEPPPFQAAT